MVSEGVSKIGGGWSHVATQDPGTVDTKMLRAGWSGGSPVRTATDSFWMLTNEALQQAREFWIFHLCMAYGIRIGYAALFRHISICIQSVFQAPSPHSCQHIFDNLMTFWNWLKIAQGIEKLLILNFSPIHKVSSVWRQCNVLGRDGAQIICKCVHAFKIAPDFTTKGSKKREMQVVQHTPRKDFKTFEVFRSRRPIFAPMYSVLSRISRIALLSAFWYPCVLEPLSLFYTQRFCCQFVIFLWLIFISNSVFFSFLGYLVLLQNIPIDAAYLILDPSVCVFFTTKFDIPVQKPAHVFLVPFFDNFFQYFWHCVNPGERQVLRVATQQSRRSQGTPSLLNHTTIFNYFLYTTEPPTEVLLYIIFSISLIVVHYF